MNTKYLSYTLIFILAVIWGSSFILMKKGLEVFRWDQVGSIRMAISFLVLLPFIIGKTKQIKKADWKFIALSGLLGNGIPSFLFPLSETRIDSALAGIINSLTPLFTLVTGLLFFHTRLAANRLAGALMIVLGKPGEFDSSNALYSLHVVTATLCYAFSVNILRHKLSHIDAILLTGFAIAFAGIPSGIYLMATDFTSRLHEPGALVSLVSILILGIFGTAISTFLFNKLIKI